jgi:hypothetical protein
MGLIRNPRCEQKRTEGYLIVSKWNNVTYLHILILRGRKLPPLLYMQRADPWFCVRGTKVGEGSRVFETFSRRFMRFNTLHHIHKMLQNCWRISFLNTQNPGASRGLCSLPATRINASKFSDGLQSALPWCNGYLSPPQITKYCWKWH